MKKKNILFITAPIKSHFTPSFYLAHLLSKDFAIYYLTNDKITGEMVHARQFNSVSTNTKRFGIGLEGRSPEGDKKKSVWQSVKLFFKNDLYRARKYELKKLIRNIQPHAIFIDIFSSTDFLLLYPFRSLCKILMFNPMLSTYTTRGIPDINHGEWLEATTQIAPSFIHFLRKQLSKYGYAVTFHFYKEYLKNKIYRANKLLMDNSFVFLFNNVPELILAPQEIEFSQNIKKNNQYYLGLSIDPKRKEIAIDKEFEPRFQEIINVKQRKRKKILYCSFGTYFYCTLEYKIITSFLLAMIEALRDYKDLIIILSVNEHIQNALTKLMQIPGHFILFRKVDQLKVLQHADAFITHGGLGSVKEAIYYKVPMLVYPLDIKWDQNGNGLKVDYHKIGLRGDIINDEPESIYAKVHELLTNTSYKTKISASCHTIKTKYSEDALNELLSELIEHPIGKRDEIPSETLLVNTYNT